jgi:hypothetical protein
MQFAPFTPPLCRRADVLLQSAVKEGLWEGHGAFLCREAYTNPVSLYGMGLEPVSDLQDRLVVTVFMQDLNSEDVTVKKIARAHLALYRAVGMDSRDEGFGMGRFLAVLRERGLEVVHPSPDVDPFVDAVPYWQLCASMAFRSWWRWTWQPALSPVLGNYTLLVCCEVVPNWGWGPHIIRG